MRFEKCNVAGAWAIDPEPYIDSRGRFMRSWCVDEFSEHRIDFHPVQGNMAYSNLQGTVRGMHYQVAPALEAKLIRCTRGSVFDVVADLRSNSPTYLQWYGVNLSSDDGRMLYIPEGCAHGCLSLEDRSEIYYLTSAHYAPDCVRGALFDDPALAIEWPRPIAIVSEQDRDWPPIFTTESNKSP